MRWSQAGNPRGSLLANSPRSPPLSSQFGADAEEAKTAIEHATVFHLGLGRQAPQLFSQPQFLLILQLGRNRQERHLELAALSGPIRIATPLQSIPGNGAIGSSRGIVGLGASIRFSATDSMLAEADLRINLSGVNLTRI
jgi:hypothetical protein